jgi:hypothetical protein
LEKSNLSSTTLKREISQIDNQLFTQYSISNLLKKGDHVLNNP